MPWDARTGGGTSPRTQGAEETIILDYVDAAVAAGGGSSPDEPVLTPFVLDVAAVTDDLLTAWSADINPTTQLWEGVSPLPDYWFCAAAPAATGAMYDRVISGWKWRAQGIATIQQALDDYTQSNGSFGPLAPPGDNSIDTMEFGKVLAVCLLIYGPTMDATQRASWQTALLAGCDYLRAHNNLSYYTNGNINVGNYATLRLAQLITDDYTTGHLAERAWWTLHRPDEAIDPSWAGWGYVFTGTPDPDTAVPFDGATSTAYFTEEGAGGNGLDWDYTHLNVSELAFLYLWDRDPRIARLINLQLNTLWPRVDAVNWLLNTMGGTRLGYAAPTTPRNIGFEGASMIVANLLLDRSGDFGDHESQFYDGTGGLENFYGAVGQASSSPGVFRGSFQSLGTFLNIAASL